MTLMMAPKEKRVTVHKITGKDDTKKFLAGLGFVEGAQVSVVNELQGNVIINVKDSRIALGKQLAQRIMVEE